MEISKVNDYLERNSVTILLSEIEYQFNQDEFWHLIKQWIQKSGHAKSVSRGFALNIALSIEADKIEFPRFNVEQLIWRSFIDSMDSNDPLDFYELIHASSLFYKIGNVENCEGLLWHIYNRLCEMSDDDYKRCWSILYNFYQVLEEYAAQDSHEPLRKIAEYLLELIVGDNADAD